MRISRMVCDGSGLNESFPGGSVENCTYPQVSGRCMSITPCGDQTQLCSGRFGILTYLPSLISMSHSTLEKLIRHWSPCFGGAGQPANSPSVFHGRANSTVQPESRSRGSFNVP